MCAEGKNASGEAQVPDFSVVGFASPAGGALTAQAHPELEGVHALQLQVCVSASYNSSTNQICFSVPVYGTLCILSPISIPVGASLKACAQTCGSIIPTGLRATVYVNGNAIWSGTVVGSC